MTKDINVEDWACETPHTPLPKANGYKVRLWQSDNFDEKRIITDATPTPEQILAEFDLTPVADYLLMVLEKTGIVELPFGKTINISDRRVERFFAFKADRSFKMSINGQRMTWGSPNISEAMLRLISRTKPHKQLVLEFQDQADQVLEDGDIVALDNAGLEKIYSRQASWKLLVQGVLLTLTTPTIIVREALVQAGLDPDKGWIAALKVKGLPREAISLDGVIDLTRKGIEKLWLRPSNIQNGEFHNEIRADFDLDALDTEYLKKRGIAWDTVLEGIARWVILRDFPLPDGYTVSSADIAVQIPATYPMAALDMFYCSPHLQLKSGRQIPQTESRLSLQGKSYQRWSRHRQGETVWNPNMDSLVTHIAIIDESLVREVE